MNTPLNSVSKDFLLGGNATFTVDNGQGKHYTFKISRTKKERALHLQQHQGTFFASTMTGPDNESHYTYVGIVQKVTGSIIMTYGSKIKSNDVRFKVLEWAVKKVFNALPLPEGYAIMHAGSCGVCGRKLTNPESLKSGIGPECIKHM